MTLTSTPEGVAALRAMVTEVMAALQPPPKLSVAQWADRERRLSSEASAERVATLGQNSRWPLFSLFPRTSNMW